MTDQPNPPRRLAFVDRISDFWAYLLPMAVFMAFTWVGGTWRSTYPATYVAKTFLVAGLLVLLWRHYTTIRWTHLGLGVLVGVVGLVQWVGMEKLLVSQPWLTWTRMGGGSATSTYALTGLWNPYENFDSAAAVWAFVVVRVLGASLVVPVMEELFWRDFAWRNLIAPNDFKLAEVGEYDRTAFFVVPAVFATVHVQWLTAYVWGLLVAWLLVRTKSLGACIVAHGVTNLLLAAYVLATSDWYFW